MLEYLKYRWHLRKLLRERQAINGRIVPPAIGEEYVPLQDEHDELELVEHRIYRLTSDYYWEKAFRHGVPVPSGEANWESSKAFPGTEHLSRVGLNALKVAFHDQRKRTLEIVSIVLAGATGLIGATTGLLAVVLGKG
ncbi:hypothetical protein [Pseudoxanthomonas mexicana]